MRLLLPFATAALTSFAVGFAGGRFLHVDAPRVENKQATSPAFANPVATPKAVDNSPAASKARIAAVLVLAEKYRGLAEDHALLFAMRQLDAGDFSAAADELLGLLKRKGGSLSSQSPAFCEAWIERWLEVDEAGALRFLEASPFLAQLSTDRAFFSFKNRVSIPEGAVFKALARRQPEWTQQHLAALKPGPTRDLGTYLLLTEAAQQDPAKAKLLLASLGDGANRPAALQGYMEGLAVADFRTGFAMALAEPAGPLREDLLKTVMSGAAKRGVGTVQELLERIDDAALRRKLAISALEDLRFASRDDPFSWIKEESQRQVVLGGWEGERNQWGYAVADAVHGTNTAPAADWAARFEGDSEKKMLVAIVDRWAWNDAPGLRNWLASHATTLEPAPAEKLSKSVKELMRTDAAMTRAWAEALPPGSLREQVRFQVALSTGAEGDLKQAAAVYESMASSDTSGALAKQLGAVLAAQDGVAAADWAMRQRDGPARTVAIQSVAEEWSRRDPRGAAEWLKQMPPGAERDSAVREYAAKAVYADPAAAVEWVEEVADPDARGKTAEQVFSVWSREDPIASRAWLRALPGVDETWRTDFLLKTK